MSTSDKEQPYTTSVIRLSFHPDHRDKIDSSEQWFQFMHQIKHQPNFGYVCKGELIDNELDIILFIAWEDGADAPAAFLSGNLDSISSPLRPFLVEKPLVMDTLYRIVKGHSTAEFTTSGAGKQYIAEMMTIRGKGDDVRLAVKSIEKEIQRYSKASDLATTLYYILDCTLLYGTLYQPKNDYDGDSKEASFVFRLLWAGQKQRSEFHDPDIPDRALPPQLQEYFASDFWRDTVTRPLEESRATTSSWIYHKMEIARDENKREIIGDEFAYWYRYGMRGKYTKEEAKLLRID